MGGREERLLCKICNQYRLESNFIYRIEEKQRVRTRTERAPSRVVEYSLRFLQECAECVDQKAADLGFATVKGYVSISYTLCQQKDRIEQLEKRNQDLQARLAPLEGQVQALTSQ